MSPVNNSISVHRVSEIEIDLKFSHLLVLVDPMNHTHSHRRGRKAVTLVECVVVQCKVLGCGWYFSYLRN